MIDDPYSKSLLHFTGDNNSTIITDEAGKIWTAYENAKITTSIYRFNPSCLQSVDGNSFISTPDHDDFNFGSGDFTIDSWVYIPWIGAWGGTFYLCGQRDSSGAVSGLNFEIAVVTTINDVQISMGWGEGTTYKSINGAYTFQYNTWTHVAVVRHGSNMILFCNGAGTTVEVLNALNNSTGSLSIGRSGDYGTGPLGGYVDEFRVSKGVARWTGNFSPPVYPYGMSQQRIIMIGGE